MLVFEREEAESWINFSPQCIEDLEGRRPGEGVMEAPEEKKWAKLLGFVSGEPKGDGQAWRSVVGMRRAMPSLELLIAAPLKVDSLSGRGGHLGPKSPRFKSLPLLAL